MQVGRFKQPVGWRKLTCYHACSHASGVHRDLDTTSGYVGGKAERPGHVWDSGGLLDVVYWIKRIIGLWVQ